MRLGADICARSPCACRRRRAVHRAAALRPPSRHAASRPRGGARPVRGQARAGDRGRRRPRNAHDRSARRRQDVARAAVARTVAAARIDEALEVASLESAAGRRPSLRLGRPFRSPQHTASVAALIAAVPRGRANCRSRISGSYFSMSCRNSRATCWRRCASPWRAAW